MFETFSPGLESKAELWQNEVVFYVRILNNLWVFIISMSALFKNVYHIYSSSFSLENLQLWSRNLRASTLHIVWISAQPHFKTHCEFNFIQSKVKNKFVCLIWLCTQGLVCLLLLSSVPVPWDNKKSLCGKLFSSRCCVLKDKTHVRQNIRNQQVSLDIQLCFCYTVYSLSL